MPPGIGVEAQFFSWQSQYIWQAGELALELPPVLGLPVLGLPALELPELELPELELPELELPALELPAVPLEFAEPPPPAPESLDPQPSEVTHNEMPAMEESDRI
jgi:hypothetical protein